MKGGKKMSPATSSEQKGTAMDYLSAPRSEGIVKSLMSLIGFEATKGGRLPAGVKIDTLKAMLEVLACEDASPVLAMFTQKVVDLQSMRRISTPKVSATPESIVQAVKSGKISLDELKVALGKL